MEWIDTLLVEHTALQAVVVIALICAAGMALGKVRIGGVSLGVTFVFFVGILAGHVGLSVDEAMLEYAESFGLVLFVYSLGLQVGPGFFSSFHRGGVRLNLQGLGVIAIGTGMAVLLSRITPVALPEMMGVLCGATTNTPGARCGAADAQPVGDSLQRRGAELRGDLSAGRRRGDSGHPRHAPAVGCGRRTSQRPRPATRTAPTSPLSRCTIPGCSA